MSLGSCHCGGDADRCGELERHEFPASHASGPVLDVWLSPRAEARYEGARQAESNARCVARAFAVTGGDLLEVEGDDAFLDEVRATLASVSRWTSDRVESARIGAITVQRTTRRTRTEEHRAEAV